MIDYDALIARVILREGSALYTDRPSDAGGPTKYGVTLATLHDWRKMPVSAEDVRRLTQDEAVRIYRTKYFPSWFEIPPREEIAELLFDDAVNAGVGGATLHVQSVLKHWHLYDGAIDGAFGPKSTAALMRVENWGAFYYAVKCERLEGYLRYVGRDPRQAEYAAGWANRSDQFELI